MPTTNKKADKLIAAGRAIRRFDRGLFHIRLTDREDGYIQRISVGIDPGSKKEAFSVKSAAHTYLNIQADAVTWVKDAEETSTAMRRSRRSRKTPYRECRPNRRAGQTKLLPSTKARFGWKLRIATWLARYYPVDVFAVEDIAALSKKGAKRWNMSFSPLQVGKDWFYYQLGRIAPMITWHGYQTAEERQRLGLNKTSDKLSETFSAHCVDSWVLANGVFGGDAAPDNTSMLLIAPLRFHRRQLHVLQPATGGVRKPYGGTRSLGLKCGTWVKHPKHGTCYVGGTSNNRLSLHSLDTGTRLCQNAKPEDLKVLCTASWRVKKGDTALLPHA